MSDSINISADQIVGNCCPECSKYYALRKNLFQHMRNVHGIVITDTKSATLKNYQCPQCGASFNDQAQLTRHMQNVHPEFLLKCKRCGHGFKNRASHQNHEKKCLRRRHSDNSDDANASEQQPSTSSRNVSAVASPHVSESNSPLHFYSATAFLPRTDPVLFRSAVAQGLLDYIRQDRKLFAVYRNNWNAIRTRYYTKAISYKEYHFRLVDGVADEQQLFQYLRAVWQDHVSLCDIVNSLHVDNDVIFCAVASDSTEYCFRGCFA